MAENSGISWTHNTQNFWVGCDKIAPECAKCYIGRILPKQGREPWGEVYRTQTWAEPWKWEAECRRTGTAKRVFTCSLSDFFHVKADPWRREAWAIIKRTPHLVWLVLTKRPALIEARLPHDWNEGYPNVWLGVSTGTRMTLNKMDVLRRIPAAVRWVSAEPLLEDISADIDLDGFGWVVVGGESGAGNEYVWDPNADWKAELTNEDGRRTMKRVWAERMRDKVKAAGLPFMFKQVTAPKSGYGYNALTSGYVNGVLQEQDWHEFPTAPNGLEWAPRQLIPDKYKMPLVQIAGFRQGFTYPFTDTFRVRFTPWRDKKMYWELRERVRRGVEGAKAEMKLFLAGRPEYVKRERMEKEREKERKKPVPVIERQCRKGCQCATCVGARLKRQADKEARTRLVFGTLPKRKRGQL